MVKKCPLCGRSFEGSRRKYCSAECSKQGQMVNQFKLHETKRKIQEKNGLKKNTLQDIARAARESGMSYGQYVAMLSQEASARRSKFTNER